MEKTNRLDSFSVSREILQTPGNTKSDFAPRMNVTLTFRDIEIEFYGSLVFTIFSMVLVCYVISSVTYFTWKKSGCFCCQPNHRRYSTKRKSTNRTITTALTLLTAITILVYMAIEIPLFFGTVYRGFCKRYHQTKIICFALGLFCVYFFFWYRIYKVFYKNPLLRRSTSKWARILNKLTAPLLVVMTTVNATVFLSSPLYETTSIGCKKVQSNEGALIKWTLLVSTTVLFQAMLLFSLLYPLNLHRKKMLGRGMDNTKSVIPIMKRAAITAVVCIMSDTVNALYALGNKQSIVYIRHIVYGSNMLVNFFALIFSFADWRERLLPCFVKPVETMSSTRKNTENFRSTNIFSVS